MGVTLGTPELIEERHDLSDFDSGNINLDTWLKRSALQAKYSNTGTTYVVLGPDAGVVGYFTLAMASISQEEASPRIKKGTGGHQIPMALLARLAVDIRYQGMGIGVGMLKYATIITLAKSLEIACHGILVHPIDQNALDFYTKYGFEPSPLGDEKLMILLKDVKRALGI